VPRIAYFDCFSGVSGDMTLAALLSAGWPASELQALPARLGLEGVNVEVRSVRRGALAALQVEVRSPAKQPHRHLHHIEAILAAADLPERVRDGARAVFRRLAEAEASVHGTSVEKVHFHEVGAVDAIVDIVGSLLGLAALGVERVFASTLPLGGGTVLCEHGRIPVPAPATAYLLKGVPVRHGPVEAELVTPTGAALLSTLVSDWGAPPPYRVVGSGLGAGAREFAEHANVLRIILGDVVVDSVAGGPEHPLAALPASRTVSVLETAIDDETPQRLADLLARLLEEGALDAMLVPVTMKKGRPGQWLVVTATPEEAERLANVILRHSTTLGVRVRSEARIELERRIGAVATPWGEVEVKIAILPDGRERAYPEFESVRKVAAAGDVTLREVFEAATAAWAAHPPR
jgi:hypothetical protein